MHSEPGSFHDNGQSFGEPLDVEVEDGIGRKAGFVVATLEHGVEIRPGSAAVIGDRRFEDADAMTHAIPSLVLVCGMTIAS
jgi:hypothetical protein